MINRPSTHAAQTPWHLADWRNRRPPIHSTVSRSRLLGLVVLHVVSSTPVATRATRCLTGASSATAPASGAATSADGATSLELLTDLLLRRGLVLDHVDHLVRKAKVLDAVSSHVALWNLPEAIAVSGGAHDVAHVQVHESVAGGQYSTVGLPILQLNHHRLILRRAQQTHRQHHGYHLRNSS